MIIGIYVYNGEFVWMPSDISTVRVPPVSALACRDCTAVTGHGYASP